MDFILRNKDDRERCKVHIDSMPDNMVLDVTVKRYSPKRSVLQNRYLWRMYTEIGEQTGYSKEEMHEIYKQMFLPAARRAFMGGAYDIVKSTTDLSTKEMADYIRAIETHALEFGLTISAPPYREEMIRA